MLKYQGVGGYRWKRGLGPRGIDNRIYRTRGKKSRYQRRNFYVLNSYITITPCMYKGMFYTLAASTVSIGEDSYLITISAIRLATLYYLLVRTILSYTRGQTLLASGSHVTYRISSPLWTEKNLQRGLR